VGSEICSTIEEGSVTTEQHLGAVFADQAAAEAAVEELRRKGLSDEHLGLAIHVHEGYVFEEDVEADLVHGVGKGVAVGAPIGAVAGMTVLALVVPGVGTLGIAGVLAAGGLSGALAGTFVGAYLGLSSEEHVLEEEWDWERVPLQPGQLLVVVSGHEHPDRVAGILERHGGELVSKPSHVS
jgi:hypothetical protein